MKYEFLPHTADIRMRISGNDPADLFCAGVRGMAFVLNEDICSNQQTPVIERSFVLESADRTTLLIDFLSEILTLSYVENAVFCTARFTQISETELACTVYGVLVDQLDEEIKAVTYTEALVEKRTMENGFQMSFLIFNYEDL